MEADLVVVGAGLFGLTVGGHYSDPATGFGGYLSIPLNRKARRTVRERRRVRMILYASARDGQGLTRLSTIPLTVKWPKAPRKPTRPRR